MVEPITFVLLVVIGVLLVFRGRPDARSDTKASRTPLILGLVLLGVGGFGLLSFWMPGTIAALVTGTVMLAIPLGVTKSFSGLMYGVFAVLIILVIGVIFSVASVGGVLVEAVAAITKSSTSYGDLVIDWISSWM